MVLMHEGSCLFIPRSNGGRLMIATDVTLTEACEMALNDIKVRAMQANKPKPIVGLSVRKVAYPRVAGKRQQSGTGWPKG